MGRKFSLQYFGYQKIDLSRFRVRLALLEKAPPMSLHLGLIRIAILNGEELDLVVDIICDTTDSVFTTPA